MSYYTPTCATTPQQWMVTIQSLMPKGPAWEAVKNPGTVMYQFWYAVATVFAWVETYLCGFYAELFCDTAEQTLPEWYRDYGIDLTAACNPWPTLCDKLSFMGGQTPAVYEALATLNGYSIDLSAATQLAYQQANAGANNVAGCATAGCAIMLAPAPTSVCAEACAYGPASNYPDKSVLLWGANRADVSCPVPGSALGQPASCLIAGFFSTPEVTSDYETVCIGQGGSLGQPRNQLITGFYACDDETTVALDVNTSPCSYTPRFVFPMPTMPVSACNPDQRVVISGPLNQLLVQVSTSGSTKVFDAEYDQLCFLNQSNIRPAHYNLIFETVA